MRSKKSPDILKLSEQALDDLNNRLESSNLQEKDKKVISAVLSGYIWIQRQLQRNKLGIRKLKNLFGFKTEKRSKLQPQDENNSPGLGDESDKNQTNNKPQEGNVTSIKKHENATLIKTMVE